MSYIWDRDIDARNKEYLEAQEERRLLEMLELNRLHPVFYMSDYRGLPGFGDTSLIENARVKARKKIRDRMSGRDRKGRKPAPPTTYRY